MRAVRARELRRERRGRCAFPGCERHGKAELRGSIPDPEPDGRVLRMHKVRVWVCDPHAEIVREGIARDGHFSIKEDAR